MRLAIVLWYLEDQNEPSKPNEKLIWLTDNIAERDKQLIEQYLEECGEDDIEPEDLVVEETSTYGDLQISYDGTHMLVTYAELP